MQLLYRSLLPADVKSSESSKLADIVGKPSKVVTLKVERLEAVIPEVKGQLSRLVVSLLLDHVLILRSLLGRHLITKLLQTAGGRGDKGKLQGGGGQRKLSYLLSHHIQLNS